MSKSDVEQYFTLRRWPNIKSILGLDRRLGLAGEYILYLLITEINRPGLSARKLFPSNKQIGLLVFCPWPNHA